MSNRRLALNRENLTTLDSDELASVAGAISNMHPLCLLTTTSAQHSQCHSCGINCTYDCPSNNCS